MNQQGIAGAGPSRHPTPPSVRKHIANVHRTIGGRPPKNCPLEVWDEYYKKFKAENDRQGVESAENSWTQLAKGEQFIEKMRHRPFPQFGNSSEEDELPKGVLPAIPATRRGQTERSQATSKKDLRKSAQPVKSATGNGQQVSKAEDEAAASLTALAQAQPAKQSSADSPQAQSDMKPKRRRTGPESLRSSLGKNWEAQVDEDGHRPARRGRKN
ncbi:uncharacterized protein F4807DRAFT_55891 [Annulohypoxylon truncatum]|uniref:uncharacterized protein n=1 Tax=Annulohypoxylon truncatum TaxID=327061 RepID=UPI0020075DB6|nr:uncharacterized protein F4807DRAFT_55891 [Annulohypoxylon truncatum]KAI1210691.1 hypothetical protein F4807DRAFT_55891 [Annulohypoxylon truncatum]